jgi:hypothetical protein
MSSDVNFLKAAAEKRWPVDQASSLVSADLGRRQSAWQRFLIAEKGVRRGRRYGMPGARAPNPTKATFSADDDLRISGKKTIWDELRRALESGLTKGGVFMRREHRRKPDGAGNCARSRCFRGAHASASRVKQREGWRKSN